MTDPGTDEELGHERACATRPDYGHPHLGKARQGSGSRDRQRSIEEGRRWRRGRCRVASERPYDEVISDNNEIAERNARPIGEPYPRLHAAAPYDDARVNGIRHQLVKVRHEEWVLVVVEIREANGLVASGMSVERNQTLELPIARSQDCAANVTSIEAQAMAPVLSELVRSRFETLDDK
jgi:hypothetical protein